MSEHPFRIDLRSLRRRVRARHVVVAAAALFVLAAVIGTVVGRGGDDSSARPAHLSTRTAPAPALPSGTDTGRSTEAIGKAAATAAAQPSLGGSAAAPQDGAPPLPNVDTAKIVQTGSVDVQVPGDQVTAAADGARAIATTNGGYVVEAHGDTNGAFPTASVTIRVPSASFGAALDQAKQLGRVTDTKVNAQDVTDQYVDLDARLNALQATRQQYETLLLRANTVSDVLTVQDRITSVQTQIEQLQGRQHVLDSQTTYATLAISVASGGPAQTQPPAHTRTGFSKAWHDATSSFTSATRRAVAGTGIVLFWILILAFAAAMWFGARRVVARRATKREA